MKKISIVLAILALALLFSTCKPATTSVDECIDNFLADLNSTDRSGVYKNLDSDAQMYAAARVAAVWDNYFPTSGIPYSLTNRSKSGNTVSATFSSATYLLYKNGVLISFGMGEDSDGNAVISTIALSGTQVYY
jgi:hypothetical protein